MGGDSLVTLLFARHFKWMNSPRVCMEALCKGRKYFYIYVNIFLMAMLWSAMSMIVIY